MSRKFNINSKFIARILFVLWIVAILIYGERVDKQIYVDIISFLLIVYLILNIVMKNKIKFHPPLISLILFTCFCFSSVLWATSLSIALQRSITLIILTFVVFLLDQYFYFNNDELFILKAIPISGMIISVYTIYFYGLQGFVNKLLSGTRLGTEFINSNTLGLFCALTVVLVIFYAELLKKKILYFLSLLPLIIVFASGSRKALVFVFISIILVYYFQIKQNRSFKNLFKILTLAIIILIIGFSILNLPIFSVIRDRFDSMLGLVNQSKGEVDHSTLERMTMIKVGLSQFYDTPFFGIGIGCSNLITINSIGYSTYLHNNYVELMATVGFFGTFLFYKIYFDIFKNLIVYIRKKDIISSMVFIILIMQLVIDVGSVSYFSKTTYIYILLGMLISLRNNKKIMNI